MGDWIVEHIPDTTYIPNGDNIAYVKITTEILDNNATKYKKVEHITLKRQEKSEHQEPSTEEHIAFKKFSELAKQKQRKHSNKRKKLEKNIK